MDKKETNLISNMSYEVAYSELEKTIAALEGGDQSLEDAINHFERGKLLTKHCLDLLEKAELKIRNLSEVDKNSEGQNEPG
jgi:exodeoxyribonuclease VII small subunit